MSSKDRPSISHSIVFTYTDDLPTASRFFKDVLELDFVVDQGPCHIFRLSATSFIGVCHLSDRPTEKGGVTISMVSEEVDEWHDFLTAKGLEYVAKPAHSDRFGVYSSLFMSPDGYRLEIQRFDDAAWDARSL